MLRRAGIKGETEVSLLFVDEETMARLNEQFLGKAGPTDVLSFPDRGRAGPDRALPRLRRHRAGHVGRGRRAHAARRRRRSAPSSPRRNAEEHGVPLDDEIALLVVHGLLHLLGMDHEVDAEAERMEALERQLLAALLPGQSGGVSVRSRSLLATSSFGAEDGILVVVIVVLLAASGVLAMAETSLVRMSRIKAKSLVDEKRRGARQLARLVENPANFLNPILLLVLICQLVSATLVGIVAEHLFGGLGVVLGIVFEVVVIFVVLRGGAEELGRAATRTGPRSSARRS